MADSGGRVDEACQVADPAESLILHRRSDGAFGAFRLGSHDMGIVYTPPARVGVTAQRHATRDWTVEASLPEYESLGYSWEEAYRLVRIGEALWDRYTALGQTIDSPCPPATALHPFEVLLQATWQAGIRELFDDCAVDARSASAVARYRNSWASRS